jgi:hypothetical protein
LNPMGISHFHLFFWNHKTDLNQTWQKCSLDGHIQDLCFWCWSEIQHIFSIGSYVKIKSSHGGHLEFPISKRFTSLVQDHPMIIPAKSQFNWLGGFWQEDLIPLKPVGQFKANMAWMVLKWSTFKIISSDPNLHPRWPPSADIVLT